MLRSLGRNLRHAIRAIAGERGYAITAATTLALGIGATTATFGVLRGVLLRPLPYAHGERVLRVHQPAERQGGQDATFSVQEIADLRAQTPSLDAVAEYHSMSFIMVGRGEPYRVQTGVVSAEYFDVLGVRAMLGRTFRPGEDRDGAPPVLLLSYEFWRDQMGSDATVIGRTVEMTDRVHTIVGVLPRLPDYPGANDVYMPSSSCPFRSSADMREHRDHRMLDVIARVRAGATDAGAMRDLGVVARRMRAEFPAAYPADEGLAVRATPLREELTADARPRLVLLAATALLVLVIACANAAGITFVRQIRRRHELAVRASLGAPTSHLLAQVVLEGVLVSLAGSALGIALAAAALAPLRALVGHFTPRAADIGLDAPVLAFGVLLAIVTGAAVAILPFRSSMRGLHAALRDGGDRAIGGRAARRLERALVVVQLAACVVLLTAAGVAIRSLLRLERVAPGFDPRGVVTLRLTASRERYPSNEKLAVMNRTLLDRIAVVPGVRRAALASSYPLAEGAPYAQRVRLEPDAAGRITAGARGPSANVVAQIASPGYFGALATPLLAGREFQEIDTPESTPVVIISDAMRRHLWPTSDAIGRRLSFDDGEHWSTIVGVVGDVKVRGLEEDAMDVAYVPLSQNPSTGLRVVARASGDPAVMARAIVAAAREIDPVIAADRIRTLDEARGDALAGARLTAILLAMLAAIATAVAAAGVGGVLAATVSRRTRELGLRLALGASPRRVLGAVLGDTVALTVAGLVLGVASALTLGGAMRRFVFGIAPDDPATIAIVCVALAAVALAAALGPARRAASLDPLLALRGGDARRAG